MKKYLLLIFLFCASLSLFSDEIDMSEYGYNENMKIVSKIYGDSVAYDWSQSLAFIEFCDADNGILTVGNHFETNTGVTTYYTKDGGNKWKWSGGGISDTSDYGLLDVSYVAPSTLYVQMGASKNKITSNRSKFLKTPNSGMTWVEEVMPFADVAFTFANTMVVINKDTIYCEYINRVMKTKYGGGYGSEYWEQVEKPADLFRYYFVDKAKLDNTIFIGYMNKSLESMLMRSFDSGQTWEYLKRPDRSLGCTFLDADTWYFAYNDRFKPNPKSGILKTTDAGMTYDTLFTHHKYIDREIGEVTLLGDDYNTIVYNNTNECVAISRDGGKNFKYIVRKGNMTNDDRIAVGGYDPDKLFLYSVATGYIMMYSSVSDVSEEIAKFTTKVYPNPCHRDAIVYIGLENDRDRLLRCKTYNSAGELMSESHEIHTPKGYHTIDYKTTGFSAGTYFIVIESDGEIIAREKFIVE